MDDIINKHLDEREKLDEALKADLESFYKKLDFEVLLKMPNDYLIEFSKQFASEMVKKYGKRYIDLGVDFGAKIKRSVIEYQAIDGGGSD